MQEKENIIDLLQKAVRAIKEEDIIKIKELSNRTIHTASIYQDPDNISIAVVLYALSKLIERKNTQDFEGWNEFLKVYTSSIENAVAALKKDDLDIYRDQINRIRERIKKLSGNFKEYLQDVFRKAQINKASKIYEHGISLQKTANILGVSIWELNQYIGQTGSSDLNLTYTKDINKRIKETEDFFD